MITHMMVDDARRLLKAVGFPNYQIRKIVGSGEQISTSLIITIVEVKMGKGAPPE